MRLLVTGAHGQLGRACLDILPAVGHETIGVDLPDGDLIEPGTADSLLALHVPDRVIHTAAYTAVDRAETHREEALEVNSSATALLAEACRKCGCALTYLSTDYVFAGDCHAGYREDAPRKPVNWYGQTKARGEIAVEALAGSCPWQIVRTSWLFGQGSGNFVRTILRRLEQGDVLRVVDDQKGCPTYAPDLAALLARLAVSKATGIFHGTNSGACTWYEFACRIATLSGHDSGHIHPCTTDEYPTTALRPVCSVLLDTKLASMGLESLPPWPDALARYLACMGMSTAEGTP